MSLPWCRLLCAEVAGTPARTLPLQCSLLEFLSFGFLAGYRFGSEEIARLTGRAKTVLRAEMRCRSDSLKDGGTEPQPLRTPEPFDHKGGPPFPFHPPVSRPEQAVCPGGIQEISQRLSRGDTVSEDFFSARNPNELHSHWSDPTQTKAGAEYPTGFPQTSLGIGISKPAESQLGKAIPTRAG